MPTIASPPLVSVIVPVYNAECYLRQTLDSICNQTLRDIEIIIVDDDSTDGTVSILQEYAAKDCRITLLRQEHQYAGAARNKGMSVAKGKYYSFLDADDLFEPTMLEKMVAQAEKVNADVVVCLADTFKGETYKKSEAKLHNRQCRPAILNNVDITCFCPMRDATSQLYQFIYGFAWDKLYRASTVKQHQFKFDEIPQCNDASFSHSMVACATVCSIIEEYLAHYRISENSVSHIIDRVVTSPVALKSMRNNLLKLNANDDAMKSFKRMAIVYAAGQLCNANNKYREEYIRCLIEEIEPEFGFLDETADFYDVEWAYQIYKRLVSPEISVVLPIYNAENYLNECLDSLKRQTFNDFEIICINDGSKDDSLGILRKRATKQHNIRIIDVPNGGYGKAMNLGLKAAHGKYFAILEPDDYLPDNAYERLYYTAESNNLELVKGRHISFYTKETGEQKRTASEKYENAGKIVVPRHNHRLFYHAPVATWSGLYRCDFIRQHDIEYHESPGASYQDTGFFMMTSGYAERAMFINDVVYMYRKDNPSSSVNNKSNKIFAFEKEFAFIKRKFQDSGRWDDLKELYLLRRVGVDRWMRGNISEHVLVQYLTSYRNELIELSDISRDCLSTKDRKEVEQLLISVDYYLMVDAITKYSKAREVPPPFPSPATQAKRQTENKVQTRADAWYGLPFLRIVEKPFKKTIYLFGLIPMWRRSVKGTRIIYRLFGIRVRHKKLRK